MKGLSSTIKVGTLFLILIVGGYGIWKTIGQRPSGESSFALVGYLSDAAGLPVGSDVVVAGLPVGQVQDLAIEGRRAKVTMALRENLKIYSNATLFKKSSSLLGNFYLEIDPGSPELLDKAGNSIKQDVLGTNQEIGRVVEATSVDALLRRLDETMPKVDAVLVSIKKLSDDTGRIINGPVESMATRLDRLVQDESTRVSSILKRTDRTLSKIETITDDIKGISGNADTKVDSILSNLDDASSETKTLVASAKNEVELTGKTLREKLDSVDEVLEPTASIMNKIDDDKGTLGRLVNDSKIADNIEEITDDAKGFLGTLFGMQTYVGLRTEYNIFAGQPRQFITVEMQTRPDKFYYIELARGPRGDYPDTTLEWDPSIGQWRRNVTIEDKFRFTFQFAKRIEWLTLRYGIKESTGGVGVDAEFFDKRLKISMDVFDSTFNRLPRLKMAAAMEFFGFLYVLAGVDDALNTPASLDIDPINDVVPVQFEEFRFGRDYFFGAMVRFNDLDLAALLAIGGASLASAGSN